MGRDLDAGHEIALLDDLAVEDREDLERIEPIDALELRHEHLDHAVGRGDEVEPALVRPADVEVGASDGLREADRRVVLVQLAGLRHQHRDRRSRIGRGERQQVIGREPATLDPALAADRQVAGQDPVNEPPGYAPARSDLLDAHAWRSFPSGETGERGFDRAPRIDGCHARSIVPRPAWISPFTVSPSVACSAAAAMAAGEPSLPDSADSTARARYATSATPVIATLADAMPPPSPRNTTAATPTMA